VEGGYEIRLTEAAVMLAMAMYLLNRGKVGHVSVHPDGEHAKKFQIGEWLRGAGFEKSESSGRTDYGGTYVRGQETLVVHPRPGVGDVVGEIDGRRVVVECKGGAINTIHAGQLSKLRRGLYEAVGLLMARTTDGAREIAAVPWTKETEKVAKRLMQRCATAGIEIALIRANGEVEFVA
jgi:hypothetical protein